MARRADSELTNDAARQANHRRWRFLQRLLCVANDVQQRLNQLLEICFDLRQARVVIANDPNLSGRLGLQQLHTRSSA